MIRSKTPTFSFIWLFLASWLVLQCATPTQPTGGPPDRTPPKLEETEPPTGTTHFDQKRIRFHFSKYIDRNSFQRAFQIEPDLSLDYEISWRRRTATVSFKDSLPENTTMIFTLGTDLSDMRNNRIRAPLQLALSTGADIDDGRIIAPVKDAETGEKRMGDRIMLYRYPYNLNKSADYVAESDSAGKARFNYLREGRYKAFWLDDRNRNRIWDKTREAAQPFREAFIELEKGKELQLSTLYVVKIDTISPVLQAVGMLSSERLRLRFSEDVIFEDDMSIGVMTQDREVTIAHPLYIDPANLNILYAQTDQPLEENVDYEIQITNIRDLSGNPAEVGITSFPGSGEPDTTYARFITHDTEDGVTPESPLVFRYAKRLDDSPDIRDSLFVATEDTVYRKWPHTETYENLLLVYPDEKWEKGVSYEIRIWDEERMERITVTPFILYEEEEGSIHIVAENPAPDSLQFQCKLIHPNGNILHKTRFTEEIELKNIPAGKYLLKVYEYRDGKEGWDPGKVKPFRPPALYFIQKEVPVEPGMAGTVFVEWQAETGHK